MGMEGRDGDGPAPGGGGAPPAVRVAVAEDHELMLEAVLSRLASDPGIEVVGTARDGEELVALYGRLRATGHRPDVVLADQVMPRLGAAEATRRIRSLDPAARVVVLSGYADETLVADSLHAGVVGYLLKTLAASELAAKVRAAAAGELVFDENSVGLIMAATRATTRARRGPSTPLSSRELQVLTLVSRGRSNHQIAGDLGIGQETVKTYLERVFRKLGVSDRASAVRRAAEAGYL